MAVSDPRKLKALENENRKLKKLLAESMLDVATLREALGNNF
jgi:putative transposase